MFKVSWGFRFKVNPRVVVGDEEHNTAVVKGIISVIIEPGNKNYANNRLGCLSLNEVLQIALACKETNSEVQVVREHRVDMFWNTTFVSFKTNTMSDVINLKAVLVHWT